ncbi:hypothetical protein [uncultured Paraglaciecola sp.]|uniref:hypothetical protein n=1 Tax=uncultured Paraglaciecola sp. TaxID=1765024 RepID=UPI002618EFC0|nr:hypothetical protein [uncultured Paraglaciecola sp.]
MNIEKRKSEKKDTSVVLKSLAGGDCFHFSAVSFEDALKEDAIYFVVAGGKEGRTQIANLKDGLLLQRDDCHKVLKLKTCITVDA